MTISNTIHSFDVNAVREQFPGLLKNIICLNNGSGALVYKGAIEW
jgi:hypothetical protein